ncbi:MAG: OmpA family protein [Flavobacterium sp.]
MRIITKLTLVMLLVSSATAFAQEESEVYNKWSVEAGVGTSNLTGLMSTSQYYNEAFAPIGFNLGARYMFNRKFGVKFAFAMDNVENYGIGKFKANLMHFNTNTVLNLSQILDFQQFTNRLGLLMNVGFGYSRMSLDDEFVIADYGKNNDDNMLNAQVGFTVQGRLTDKLVVNLDASQRYLALNTLNLDGTRNNDTSRSRIDGGVLNFSLGLTYYLGSNAKHVDWTPYEVAPDLTNELEELQNKIAELEDAAVTKNELMKMQQKMDEKIQEGIIKSSEMAQTAINNSKSGGTTEMTPAFLMNNDYVAAYFEFNKRKPTNVSTNGIDFLVTYLRKNPASKVTLIGYADEVGNSKYNDKLAKDRAESVKDMIIKAGVDANRIEIKSGGEDNSVDPKSDLARTIVRRVVFRVN